LGRIDGGVDADRDSRRDLLPARPAPDRVRPHPGSRPGMIDCLLPSFEGPEAPDWLRRLVAEGVGGVVLFGSNLRDREQLRALTSTLRAERSDLLIALD